MKVITSLFIQILITSALIGQYSVSEEIINSNMENVLKITEYKSSIDTSSTFTADSILDLSAPLRFIEHFDASGLMIKKEYRGKRKIPLIKKYNYVNGRLQSSRPESLETSKKKHEIETIFSYDENGLSKSTTIYSDGSKRDYFVQYNQKLLPIAEFMLDDNLDTTMVIYYTYNEDQKVTSMTYGGNGKLSNKSVIKYDNKKRRSIVTLFYENGEKKTEEKYHYISDNNFVITVFDYKAKKEDTTRIIKFKDKHSNVIKKYVNSKYDPAKWHVYHYKIEYRK